jgi:RNA polymerase sigma-70 factor, ECF subfamily
MMHQNKLADTELLIHHIEAILQHEHGRTLAHALDETPPFFPSLLFERLTEQYGHQLSAYIYPLLCNHEDVEDVLQEVWMAFYQRIQDGQFLRWSEHFHVLAWLKHIARMRAYTYRRKRPSTLSLDVDHTAYLLEPTIPLAQYPEQIAIRNSISEILSKMVENLPLPQREVLTLYFYNNYKLEEISQTLNLRLNTVKSHHRRGLQKLRGLLVECMVTNGDLEFWELIRDQPPTPMLQAEQSAIGEAL